MTNTALRSAALVAALALPARAADPGTDFFEAKVRPVLVEHCYKCHSAEAKKQQGGLHLDTRDALRAGGDNGPAVVPGKPDESRLVKAVRYTDPDLQMPPKGKLPDAAIADLEKWVALGAPDPRGASATSKAPGIEDGRTFWSFQRLRRPNPPELRTPYSELRTPIDRFIVARLDEKGLTLSPPADRRTLIRRAYFDLIGLPPTPEEVAAFVNDPDPDAYAKLIDQLLASPHYGERWGRHWLDVARYGESSGYEHDNDRPHSYQYRDFVIQALNSDLPFDWFVQWQIAGDELAPDDPLAVKATGFLAVGLKNGQVTEREAESVRYEVFDDWVGTLGTAFLGLTTGCARCHDHKYDPIPTKDYYRLAANFTAAVRANVNVPRDPSAARRLRQEFKARHARLVEARRKFEAEVAPDRAEAWRTTKPPPPAPLWLVLEAKEAGTGKDRRGLGTDHELTRQPDGSYLFTQLNGAVGAISFVAHTPLTDLTAVRIEALTDDRLPNCGPGFGDHGHFTLSGFTLTASPLDGKGKPQTVKLTLAESTTGTKRANWSVDSKHAGKDQAAVYKFDKPAGFPGGTVLRFTLTCPGDSPAARQTIGKFRLSVAAGDTAKVLDAPEIGHDDYAAAVKALADDKPSPAVTALYCRTDADWLKLDAAVRESWANRPVPPYDVAFAVTEGVPPYRMMIQGPDLYETTHVLKRGDVDKKDGEATPGFLQVLTPLDGEARWQAPPLPGARTTLRRAALARWLTDVDRGAGALLARVIVNRLWHHHFGRGIVATPSDFGAQGERPTHPELLDWLASELIARGWSLKAIHREIMLSATYRQSSIAESLNRNPQPATRNPQSIDPDNKLLWRKPLQRLEAEAVRDAMLAVSGRLDPRPFGPGFLDEGMTRRSIYFTVKRSQLIPSLVQLDFPESLTGIGQRVTTTVAPQALLMLNNPHVRANAAAFAERLRPVAEKSLADAVTAGYERAIGRDPTADETRAAVAFLQRPAEGGLPEALTDFCQTLFAVNEFFYVK
jgi:hypothetical protein